MRTAVLALASLSACGVLAAAEPSLDLVATIAMPGVKGRIDHLVADPANGRLFVAALGNGTVEVIDAGGARKSLPGFKAPQGVAYIAAANRVFVANGGGGVDVLDGGSLAPAGRTEGLEDADNVRHDAAARHVIVGYGRGALAFLEEGTGRVAGRVDLPAHPESFQLEQQGPRIFVNVPRSQKIAVVDRRTRAVTGSWDVEGAIGNYAMALDEDGRRLFVATRMPARLLVYDIDSGKNVARLAIGGDVDDLFFDATRKRVYAICGEGRVDIIRREAADRYALEAFVKTAPRARTGLFVAAQDKLYVAAPADGATPARILVFRLR